MDQQAMNLLLKLSIDFIEHFKANQLVTNNKFVAIFKQCLIDSLAVEQRPVR